MEFCFAPLEGVTGYTYRNVHNAMFNRDHSIGRYFAPFIQPKQTLVLETSEKKNIAPENNVGISLVPQIMANKAELFLWAANELHLRGYDVVNLNLGCPRATIVTRRKGSGMLDDLDGLASFLDGIFDGAENIGVHISIKTRLGTDNFDHACELMELFNRYPLYELIIHPRTRKDMYSGSPNLDVFEECLHVTRHDICYNGNIFTKNDYDKFIQRFSQYTQIKSVMPGRGLIANPALVRECNGGARISVQEIHAYHDELYRAYDALNYGTSTLLHRMDELWFYLAWNFPDSEKSIHKIRKTKNCADYLSAVARFFDSLS